MKQTKKRQQIEVDSMELFKIEVRRLANGHKMFITFESGENLELEKKLIDFRGERVSATITQSKQPDKPEEIVTFKDEFEFFKLQSKRYANGNKLSFALAQPYKKENEFKVVALRYEDCKLFMKRLEPELDLEQKARGEIEKDAGNELNLDGLTDEEIEETEDGLEDEGLDEETEDSLEEDEDSLEETAETVGAEIPENF